MHYVLVPGTWGRDDIWWRRGGPLRFHIERLGHTTSVFDWSTDLDGVMGKNTAWLKAGFKLYDHLKEMGNIGIITHSHGAQVAFYAIGKHRLRPVNLITVAAPIRKDMRLWREFTRRHCHKWVQVYGTCEDYWQWLGSWFDGSLRFTREAPEAYENVCIPGATHGEGKNGLLAVNTWKQHNLSQYLEV